MGNADQDGHKGGNCGGIVTTSLRHISIDDMTKIVKLL